jgi:hypothetical protein
MQIYREREREKKGQLIFVLISADVNNIILI